MSRCRRSLLLATVLVAAVAWPAAAQQRDSSSPTGRASALESSSAARATASWRVEGATSGSRSHDGSLPGLGRLPIHRFPLCFTPRFSRVTPFSVLLLSPYGLLPALWVEGTAVSPDSAEALQAGEEGNRSSLAEKGTAAEDQLTLLVLKNGSVLLARELWLAGERIVYLARDGTELSFPLAELDLELTVRLNAERGVDFVLRSGRQGGFQSPRRAAKHLYVPVTVAPH